VTANRPSRALVALLLAAVARVGGAQVSILTHHYDNARTGANTQETILTPSNVAPDTFGLLFARRVDGAVYAQPLYVPNVAVPGKGTHNAVYVATENDSVYAFDADTGKRLWRARLTGRGERAVPSRLLDCGSIVPKIGITSTPVIDPNSDTLYAVTKAIGTGGMVQKLHALDIATGEEKLGGPVVIAATVPGTAAGGTTVEFDGALGLQRTALTLANGVVYIAWASHCDQGAYHGWVIAYDAATLGQVAAFNASPDGAAGGIWQSGGGFAVDSDGDLYVAVGNGTFNAQQPTPPNTDFGESLIKFGPDLAVLDYFTPFNQADLSAHDEDLGSGAPLLLPDQPGPNPHLAVVNSKGGMIYVVDRDAMGEFHDDSDHIVQSFVHLFGGAYGMPAYWNGVVYFGFVNDAIRAFPLTGTTPPLATTSTSSGPEFFGFPGATPVVSANGVSNGIVWVLQTDTFAGDGPAVLRAYDATDLSHELYHSDAAGPRDVPGKAVRFTVPVVVNGKVYVGAVKRLAVYGLR
jgi:outer membrane protein assembly factor BamB